MLFIFLIYIYIYISNFVSIRYYLLFDPNLVVANDFNFTQYFFIECEIFQILHWITFSSYIFYTCKISKRSKINNYVINQMFKFQVFVI